MSGLALGRRRARRRRQRLRPRGVARARAPARGGYRGGRRATTPANLPAGAEVIVSTAIPADNPELAAARARRARRCCHRADLLGELSRMKRSIAISGTHGKTTTAGMVVEVLRATGREPAFLVGGELRGQGTNAAWGGGGVDRRRGRRVGPLLPRARPRRGRGHERRARPPRHLPVARATSRPPSRRSPRPAERADPRPRSRRCRAPARPVSYGSTAATCAPRRSSCSRSGRASRSRASAVELRVPGRHNVLNALAALAACRAAGVPVAEAAPALAGFAGRRAAVRGARAHRVRRAGVRRLRAPPDRGPGHAEAARTLDAPRLVACFQPHLYSRTRELAPRVRPRAGARRRRGGRRRLPGARARRGLPGHLRPDRRARGGRRRAGPAGLVDADARRGGRGARRAAARRATCC